MHANTHCDIQEDMVSFLYIIMNKCHFSNIIYIVNHTSFSCDRYLILSKKKSKALWHYPIFFYIKKHIGRLSKLVIHSVHFLLHYTVMTTDLCRAKLVGSLSRYTWSQRTDPTLNGQVLVLITTHASRFTYS